MSADTYFRQPAVSSTQSRFARAPQADIPRSTFDRSHAHKTTFNPGKLVPVFLDEVLPGDTFDMNATGFIRLATPLKPVMDNLHADLHWWFIPNRLVWTNWERFMGERETPTDDPDQFSIPQAQITLSNVGGVADQELGNYFGLPQVDGVQISVTALPFRAYALIWNEWYRDQNLQNPITFSIDDGPDTQWSGAEVVRRGKRHDYFTSSLPFPQKGDPVSIPIGDRANVAFDGGINGNDAIPTVFNNGLGGGVNSILTVGAAPGQVVAGENPPGSGNDNSLMYADLSNATSVTINDLRTAFQIQKLLERDARGGTRYIELILSHFGVRSDDARLQRPELLGTSHAIININPVASTVALTDLPQGQLSAVGTGLIKGGFSKSFTEHGHIIGLVSTRADLTYQQGIERFWSRQTRYDFYWPAFAHLGEQAVLNKEIFVQGTADDDGVFGYQERFAEYRYKPSRITGQFSSLNTASLDVWHYSQEFLDLPTLNTDFIQDVPPVRRTVAVPDEPIFISDWWFKLKCTRPMPVYSVPGLIDHF